MKKHTEKPPVDDLFARKLGNMSLPPSADGFARLQARMNQQKPEPRLVFWRNPIVQPYMAAAACLALVCLFGWLYWPSGPDSKPGHNELAVNKKSAEQKGVQAQHASANQPETKKVVEAPAGLESITNSEQVASTNKAVKEKRENLVSRTPQGANAADIELSGMKQIESEPVIAQTKTVENRGNVTNPVSINVTPMETAKADHVAEVKAVAKPAPSVERVLEVTIAEPQTLLAARQEAKAIVEEKAVIAQNDKAEKETKASLWQQVKRIKQGEIFARQDDITNEDRSLLGRAYSGLKHSLDKEKAAKQ
ncbi:hypothetical protein [Spirosoma linguale]|uniref:Uncharacterized protein n=1 Tax=Spirosoma linguale (strain ATCC 33905 / DSM 74 / LMG 10896 / Claus 1) TaxID=504472 RepID=D2QS65_SPILD|nr:hypothetical protein Slin_5682 [Spirosoma linguale DSM 74]